MSEQICLHDGGFDYMDPGPFSDDIVLKVCKKCHQDVLSAPPAPKGDLEAGEEIAVQQDGIQELPTIPERLLPLYREAIGAELAGVRLDRGVSPKHIKMLIEEFSEALTEVKALSSHCESLQGELERLMDLVRYERSELYAVGLINDAEYAALVQDSDSGQRVARLETYDHLRAALARERELHRWRDVTQELPPLDAENCCMDESDYGRYSQAVIVFDEDEAAITSAVYDGRKQEWTDARNGGEMFGITHWRTILEPLSAPKPAATEEK
jgi:hypothetical protein